MSLPTEYNHFYSAWESVRAEDQNLNTLRARLMAEEIRMGAQEKQKSEALLAKRQYRPATKGQQNKFVKTTTRSQGCFKCGDKGHLKRNAPQIKKVEPNANHCRSYEALMCSTNASCSENNWVLDSGATDHMCHIKEWFESLRNHNDIVRVGDGRAIKAADKGNIVVLVSEGHKWVQKVLKDVLYVPGIQYNLFLSTKALDRGYKFHSNSSTCKFVRGDGSTVAVGVQRGKLFNMLIKVPEGIMLNVAVADNLPLQIWYGMKEWVTKMQHM
ncbi:uncharacterized protein LOC119666120 [Teleopsis dalmanni]|uniref:uncharacterized protein LOC119666120 n=1 Tax=Teleopsis dalmanni TaxID=139649 RepID=UPI0018CD1398|nr:uncharacterized protein LOC119666120 [Teleopsis dalmanni]